MRSLEMYLSRIASLPSTKPLPSRPNLMAYRLPATPLSVACVHSKDVVGIQGSISVASWLYEIAMPSVPGRHTTCIPVRRTSDRDQCPAHEHMHVAGASDREYARTFSRFHVLPPFSVLNRLPLPPHAKPRSLFRNLQPESQASQTRHSPRCRGNHESFATGCRHPPHSSTENLHMQCVTSLSRVAFCTTVPGLRRLVP